MQIHRNEVTTGLFVLIAFGIFVAILIVIGIPGVMSGVNVYRIYFDNASGIRSGAPVLLAGREIGKVSAIYSPVPLSKRPKGHENYEVAIDVKVESKARVYQNTKVQLKQQTLMGVRVIDFSQGDEKSSLAKDGGEFVGERIPDLGESLTGGLKRLTEPSSDFAITLKNAREFSDTLKREPWRLIWPGTKQYPEDKKKR
jgi:ABC-type transporter Mla subunit MlaD